MKKPFAYITAVWKGGEFTVIDQAAVYCRKVYEAGFTPICPVLYTCNTGSKSSRKKNLRSMTLER